MRMYGNSKGDVVRWIVSVSGEEHDESDVVGFDPMLGVRDLWGESWDLFDLKEVMVLEGGGVGIG